MMNVTNQTMQTDFAAPVVVSPQGTGAPELTSQAFALANAPDGLAIDPTVEAHFRKYTKKAELEKGIHFLRLTPLGIDSPALVAVLCFVVTTVICCVAGLWMNAEWFDWPSDYIVAGSVVIGSAFGIFDFFYTKKGHENHRWDLMFDPNQQLFHIPAPTAYTKPILVDRNEILHFELRTLQEANRGNNKNAAYRLYIVCQNDLGSANKHTVKQSTSRKELLGLACWLHEILELRAPIEFSTLSGGTAEMIKEMRTTSIVAS